jgi:DNA polymerase-3 subunit epsilon
MGVAKCPCDGSLDPSDYRLVVETLLKGLDRSPTLLLEPLVDRMRRLAREQRYEEAASLRDRHNLLARALETRRVWRVLLSAGYVVAEDARGRSLAIDHGRLVGTRAEAAHLVRTTPEEQAAAVVSEVPPNVEAAEEARLLWKWLDQEAVSLLDIDGTLNVPVDPIIILKPEGARAA